MRLEYELVDANRLCPGIDKVREGHTKEAVTAICSFSQTTASSISL